MVGISPPWNAGTPHFGDRLDSYRRRHGTNIADRPRDPVANLPAAANSPPPPAPSARSRSTARATTVRALDGVDRRFPAGRFTAIMGPSGSGKSHADALPRRARHAHVRPGVHRRRRPRRAQRQAAHAAAPRQHRLHLPGVQPGADADRHREHHAPADARRPQARRGVARPRDRAPSGWPTASTTARASCPAASSSASPSPARWPAARRSSSPTSPPATSTAAPAPRSSRSCARPCASSARRS